MKKICLIAAGLFLVEVISACASECGLYPIALSTQSLNGAAGETVITDIANGSQPGNFGWLTWAGSPSERTLVTSLTLSGDSYTYSNPDNPDDHVISVGDWISGRPGVSNSKNVRNALDTLKTVDIVVPVWDDIRGQGANAAYRVSGFARVRILSYTLPGHNRITARFLGFVSCGEQNQAPVVHAGGDQSVTFPGPANLQGSVTDDGQPQSATLTQCWSVVSGPGSVVFANSNAVITTAIFNAPGVFTLRLTASDTELTSHDDLDVTVNMPNQPPTAFPQQVAVAEDTALAITLSGIDPEADPIAFAVTVPPNHGTLTGTPPQIVYQPLADYNGPDLFMFKANDGQLDSSNATVNITITPVNDPPVADSLTLTNVEDAVVRVMMSGADVDGDILSFVIVGNPDSYTLGTVHSNTVDCTPPSDFNGIDTFKYVTYDGLLYSVTATVTLVTLPVNDVPVAAAQAVTLDEDTFAAVTLSGSDPDGDQLTFQVMDGPTHGTLAGTAPNLTYTPAAGYFGPDSFRFVVADPQGAVSAPATVAITVVMVNAAPTAIPQSVTLAEDTFVAITLAGSDPDGDPLTFLIVEGPAHGVLTNDAPQLAYIPAAGYVGPDTFRFVAVDAFAATSAPATVTLTVTPVNKAPRVNAGPDVALAALEPVTLRGAVTDDGLPDGGALRSRWLVVAGDVAAVAFDDPARTNATATFAAPGDYTLRLTALDGAAAASDEMTVSIRYPNETPTVDAGADFEVEAGSLVALDGTVTDDDQPKGGILAAQWSVVAGGAATVEFANSADLATPARFTMPGTFTLRLTASDGALSAEDTVTVTVRPVPNRPPAVDAGASQEVALFTSCRLFGVAEDDGLPEASALAFQWTQVDGPGASVISDPNQAQPSVTFSSAGLYRFRLTTSDGELSAADETTVSVALANQPPVVDAGADFEVTVGLRALLQGLVTDDGLPQDGVPTAEWTLVSGPGVATFERPGSATSPVEVSAEGEYRLCLHASDGELEASDEVVVRFGSPTNQPPSVEAGPDQTIAFNPLRSGNLLVNGDAETPVTPGAIPGWTWEGQIWMAVAGGTNRYPVAAEGSFFFCPTNSAQAELWQEVDASAFADTIDVGEQLFEFSICYRVAEQVRYDQPRVRVEYRAADGSVLAASDISPTPLSGNWGLLADTRAAPPQTRAVRVRLFAENSGIDAPNNVYYDKACLQGVSLMPIILSGSVTDDGLPENGALTSEWRTVSGPVAAVFDDPSALDAKVFFPAPGVYELSLTATDGEVSSEDRMTVTVTDNSGTQPLQVDAGTDLTVQLPLALALPQGVVQGGSGAPLTLSWTEVSGHARVYIEGADTLQPRIRFYELGEYTLRLSVSDGTQVAYDEMRVSVTCPEILRPMDVALVIDKSGSMYELGGEKIKNAIQAAQLFAGRLLPQDRAAVVPFINEGVVVQPLTFDYAAVTSAIPQTPAACSQGTVFGTAVDRGISVAADHLLAEGRPGAEWVILLLSDGESGYAEAIQAAQAAQASGIRIISVGLCNGTDEGLMSAVADSRADYFFAEDASELEGLYESFARTFCRIGEEGLEVYTGPTLRLPNVETRAQLKGRVAFGQSMDQLYPLTAEWMIVSGPGTVTFGNAASAATTARFSEPGVYTLALTSRVYFEGAVLYEKTRMLTAIVDQPTSSFAPSGLVALWKGEGNTVDSVSNLHGIEPFGLKYGAGVVQQSFEFEDQPHVVRVPAASQLDIGRSAAGFTVECWTRFDTTVGNECVFGWYTDYGSLRVGLQKPTSSTRVLLLQMQNTAGSVRSYYTPSDTYTTNRWHHFALVYERSSGFLRFYRDGFLLLNEMGSALGTNGCATVGDFIFGGNPDGSQPMHGALDEVSIYSRPLQADEVSAIAAAGPQGKLVLDANARPVVDAGPDRAVASVTETVPLSGTASDDGFPLGSRLRTRWSKLAGPDEVAFDDPGALETTATFAAPGVYTLQLSADDGVALVRDTVRVTVGGAGDSLTPPSGLRAHWPAEGTGREVVGGFDANPVGPVAYEPGAVGEGFAHAGTGFMIAHTDGGLNVGSSTNGFTLEFWARLGSSSIYREEVLAGWYGASGAQFAIIKPFSGIYNRLSVTARSSTGSVTTRNTADYLFATNQWQHFAFVYTPASGQVAVFRDGIQRQTLALPAGGIPTPGDFCIGGYPDSSVVLSNATDEISVYDRQLAPEEIWAIFAASACGKAVMGQNLSPAVEAGSDQVILSASASANLSGTASDDSLPLGSCLRTRWSKLAGPGEIAFDDPLALETAATFAEPGVYTLELTASDGIAVSRDTLRVTVGWGEGTALPASGLRAHWPAEGTGQEVVGGFDAYSVGPVAYGPGAVGEGFDHSGGGLMLAHTGGGLDVGASTNGFTVEFWARLVGQTAIYQEEVLAGWYDASGAQFAITKPFSGIYNRLSVTVRSSTGSVTTRNTADYLFATNQWQHFAFVYTPASGQVVVFRDGIQRQTLALPAGGIPTPGDFSIGGRIGSAIALQGATDEMSVYDRALAPEEICAIFAAGACGKAVMGENQAPAVLAGPDFALASTSDSGLLDGAVADDGLPAGCVPQIRWRQLAGPGTAAFDDETAPQTAVRFDVPGVYTLELSANDGLVVSRDTLRVEVAHDGAVPPPSGLCAHWPAEGTGQEVVGGFDGYPIGPVAYGPGAVGECFDHSCGGLMLAHTGGGLNVGTSANGFTVEFWARLVGQTALYQEEVLAGWYDASGAQFAIIKPFSGIYNRLRVSARASTGSVTTRDTADYLFATNQWQHFAFVYTPASGQVAVFRDGVQRQVLTLPAGGIPTPGDFSIGGRIDSAIALHGATDEMSVYDRALDASEIQALYAAGAAGKTAIPANQTPAVFADFDRVLTDTFAFDLTGLVRDDGLPAGSALQTAWTQLDGPAPAQLADPAALATGVTVPAPGRYTFRLSVSDGERDAFSDVAVEIRSSVPGNLPPTVSAGDPLEITLPDVASLAGAAADPDAGPSPLATLWSCATGPGTVTFADPASPVTAASFSEPGVYTLRLTASDGAATVFGHVSVTVKPAVSNAPPVVSAGDDFAVAEWSAVTLEGSGSDDGVPAPLAFEWSQLSGPTPVFFEDPDTPDTRAQFTRLGTYVLQLTAFDGEKQSSDEVTVSVYGSTNCAPVIDAGAPLAAAVGVPLKLQPVITDDGLPSGRISFNWRLTAGPGGLDWSRNGDGDIFATFSLVGEYTLLLTASDGEFTVTDTLPVTVTAPGRDGPSVTLVEPGPGLQAPAGGALALVADAADPQGTVVAVSFYAGDTHLGTRTNAPWRMAWQNLPTGTQTLYAVAMNDVGQYRTSAPVVIDLRPVPPGICLLLPEEGSFHAVGQPILMQAAPVGGVAVDAVEFLANGATVASADTPPYYVATYTVDHAGTVTLQARALLTGGGTLLSDPGTIRVAEPDSEPVTLTLDTPAHGSTVTAPTDVTGTLTGGDVAAYTLQFRSRATGRETEEDWQTLATGTAPVGAPGAPAVFGRIDPTLLRNGAYELRVIAADIFGATTVFDGHTLVFDGGMKVGQFQLAFEDLNIPLVGIPVQLIRSYDSRGTSGSDFGPDWELGFRSVQVQTSEPVGEGWEDYVTRVAAGVPFYGVRPVRRHVVSVVVGDEVQQFEAYSPTEQGFFPLEAAAVAFRPINGSVGTLTLQDIDTSNLFITRSGGEVTIIDFTALGALDPEEWVYRTADGTRLDIRRVFGLRKLTDRNANTLTFTEDGITHSSGESIAFTRDAAGRITAVTAPGGVALGYAYDAHGYLAAFTNRAGEVTAYDYVPHPADPDSGRRLLHAITDPLGNRALAAGYDDDGRLVSQTDAAGHAVTFDNDIPNRRQTVTDRLGNVTVHEYDLSGNIVRTVDALGGVTLRGYDDNDNEVRVTDPLGNVTTRTYDANRNKLTETDPLGHTVSFSYDAYSQPTTNIDARGNATVFTYDANGNLTSMAGAIGGSTAFSYDASGNLLSMADALGNTTAHTYNGLGRIVTTTVIDPTGLVVQASSFTYDGRGNRTGSIQTRTLYSADGLATGTQAITNRFEYDADGHLVKTVHADGTTDETAYNSVGQEIRTVDALGLVTSHEYDDRGNRVRTNRPDGTATVWTYDAENRQLSETQYDANGQIFKASATGYDALGRKTAVIRGDALNGQGQPEGPAEITEYDAAGRVTATSDALGNVTRQEYDPACGSVTAPARVIDALGNVTRYTYDANGNRLTVTDANGNTVTTEYDIQNRPVRVTNPDGTFTETVYDAAGRRAAMIDELGRRTDYAYDTLGRLAEVVQPAPTPAEPRPVTRYAYDEAGNRIAQTDALGRTTRFGYDAMGRRTTRTLPGGETETYTYDGDGQLAVRTDFNGRTMTYAYDTLGRLVEECGDPAHSSLVLPHAAHLVTHAFDAAGRPCLDRVWNGAGELLHEASRSYDLRGRLAQAASTYGTLNYAYDEADNLTAVASYNTDGVRLAYTYDALNRLSAVCDYRDLAHPLEHAYAYTPVGSLASVVYANGVTHTYDYNSRNRLTGLQIGDAQAVSLNAFGYQLNAAGHRTRIDEATGRTRLFAYDGLNRLTSEQVTGDPAGENGAVVYTYDLVGNRLSRSSTLPGVASQSNAYDVNDRLDSDTYDSNGNTTAASGITSGDIYDPWNRLVRRFKPDGTVVDLCYDSVGNRVSKAVYVGLEHTFTAYLVDASSLTGYAQVLEELREDGLGGLEVFRTYAAGNDLISQTQLLPDGNGGEVWATHYYLYDGQGSVWGLADGNGLLTDTYTYDAFGLHLREEGAGTPNNIRYTGEMWDADLGQYYLRARYYEPSRGRFWTMDSFEGFNADPISLHKYLYANTNPVIYTDPSGRFGKEASVIINNLLESSRVGREVHKFIQSDFMETGGGAERAIVSILREESPHESFWSRIDPTTLLSRPDLYHITGKYIFEIKPVLQFQTAAAEVQFYLSALNRYSPFSWREGTNLDYTPPANFTTSSGSSVVINQSIHLGVISYYVDPVEVRDTVAVTAVFVAAEISKSMLHVQATTQAGAFAGIEARQATSAMFGTMGGVY